jgi:hypothetical protein
MLIFAQPYVEVQGEMGQLKGAKARRRRKKPDCADVGTGVIRRESVVFSSI